MHTTLMDDVTAIDKAISKRIGVGKHKVWFKNSTQFSVADGYLTIGVPNHFIGSWIENHFMDDIQDAIREVTGDEKKITFNVDASLSGTQKKPVLDSQAKSVRKAREVNTRRRVKPKAVKVKPLKLSLDTFIAGPGNELAFNAARAVVSESKTLFNPLFLHGGYGVGKTHLLQGICNEISKQRPGARWIYVSAEEFANEFVIALKTQKLDAFRRRFRQADVLAIDDIHFLASKPSMQEEFLHTFNTIDLAGKQIVLASDAHPKMIGQLCEKLVSRFVSGMVVKMESPDFETRCSICRQRAAEMKKHVPDEVIEHIAGSMHTNVRELEGALLKLVAFASIGNGQITLRMAEQVLAEHISRTDPIVHISDIDSATATYFGITPADIHSSKKDRTVSTARSFSMYLARKYTKMSYPEIGKLMGGKNHATVILACRKVEKWIKGNSDVKWKTETGQRVVKALTVLDELTNCIG
ncbi:Chromosomal replication initiator protein DnaA [Anaerohalosphaera lusitana]|uniref:Chromosomal replication initiator protein DnaA n=1 Tax=Anaerohalosphaera lusitana TaxID=1936003 RepID=A0A1U9NG08_9BACT|nr:chromosomal replication initiator protein DnaA [Anaerohalosphaera lusitana]AQT66863.1 Chromosomal replication initiator protein DnaA [Anaerohalosphaera lusitana]